MPTLPLFHPPATANAWHDVVSPGGYEWWYFDATDETGQIQVIVAFFQGCPFSAGYRKAWERYRRRPTRHAPPVPADWPRVGVLVLREGKTLARLLQPFDASQFSASRQGVSVAIGGNTIQRLPSGQYRVHVELPDCRVRMTLAPVVRPPIEERTWAGHAPARHRWIVAAPLCRAEATIEVAGESASLNGPGYHDHNYGTAPPHEAARRVFVCRMLLDDRAVLLRLVQPVDRSRADDVTSLDASGDGILERSIADAAIDWGRPGLLRPRHPRSIVAGEISLSHPRTLFVSPSYSRLSYEMTTGRHRGSALAEVVEF